MDNSCSARLHLDKSSRLERLEPQKRPVARASRLVKHLTKTFVKRLEGAIDSLCGCIIKDFKDLNAGRELL